jgi:hypothetical protein
MRLEIKYTGKERLMKKWLSILTLGVAVVANATNTVINFTSAEGYADALLDGQQSWTAQSKWVVDSSDDGSVSVTGTYQKATYTVGSDALSEGDTISGRGDFHYEGSSLITPASTFETIRFGFANVNDNTYGVTTEFDGTLLKVGSDGNAYLKTSGGANIAWLAADVADYLAVEYSLMMGADAAGSSMSFTLYNLTDETSVSGSYTGLQSAVFNAASLSGLFSSMQAGNWTGNTAGITSIVVDSVTTFVPADSTHSNAMINFTLAEGYTDGLLTGQQSWVAQTQWAVDASGDGSASVAGIYQKATYTAGSGALSAGDTLSGRGNFHYEGSLLKTPASTFETIRFGFANVNDNTYGVTTGFAGALLKVGSDGNAYLKDSATGSNIAYFKADVADYLAVEYTLTMGIDAAGSSMSFTLFNLTKDTSVSGSFAGLPQAVFDAAASSGLFGSMQAGNWTGNTAGITSIVVDSATPLVFSRPPVGFDAFVGIYGLSGTKTDDFDSDGLNDYGEYVFGGVPNDDSNLGVLPALNTENGDYVFSLIGYDSIVARVLSKQNLTEDSWTTNGTFSVIATDGELSAYTNAMDMSGPQLFIKLIVE